MVAGAGNLTCVIPSAKLVIASAQNVVIPSAARDLGRGEWEPRETRSNNLETDTDGKQTDTNRVCVIPRNEV